MKIEKQLPSIAATVYFLTLAAVYIRCIRDVNYFALTNWFITYEAGYIKRGLMGTLFQVEWLTATLSLPTSIVIQIISTFFLILCYFTILMIAIRLSRIGKMAFVIVPVLLTSPLLLTLTKYIGYFDVEIYLLIFLMAFMLSTNRIFYVILLSMVAILVHESSIVFYVPLLMFRGLSEMWFDNKTAQSAFLNKKMLAMILAPCVFFLFVLLLQSYWLSVDEVTQYIARVWQRNHLYKSESMIRTISTSFAAWFISESPEFFHRAFNMYGLLTTGIPLIFINSVLYFGMRKKIKDASIFVLLVVLLELIPLLLFLVAWDIDRIWSYPLMLCFVFAWQLSEREVSLDFSALQARWFASIGLALTMLFVCFPFHLDNIDTMMCLLLYSPVILFMSVLLLKGHFQ